MEFLFKGREDIFSFYTNLRKYTTLVPFWEKCLYMQPCRRVSFTIPDHKSHMELNCGIQFNCLNFHYLSLITSFHTLSFLFFLPNIIFLIERRLQCCVGFCHTIIQVSHNYIYISSPPWACLPSLHPNPLGQHRLPGWASCVIQQLLTSYLFYTW